MSAVERVSTAAERHLSRDGGSIKRGKMKKFRQRQIKVGENCSRPGTRQYWAGQDWACPRVDLYRIEEKDLFPRSDVQRRGAYYICPGTRQYRVCEN